MSAPHGCYERLVDFDHICYNSDQNLKYPKITNKKEMAKQKRINKCLTNNSMEIKTKYMKANVHTQETFSILYFAYNVKFYINNTLIYFYIPEDPLRFLDLHSKGSLL